MRGRFYSGSIIFKEIPYPYHYRQQGIYDLILDGFYLHDLKQLFVNWLPLRHGTNFRIGNQLIMGFSFP